MKTKIDAKENYQKFVEHMKAGEEQKATAAIRAIFEPLIRRDDEELDIQTFLDLIAVAAYSSERAKQLWAVIEMEKARLAEDEREEIDRFGAWMQAGAMNFLEASVKAKEN